MKKTMLFFVLLAAAGCLQAQDTLHMTGPKSNYYSHFWPDTGDFVFDGVMRSLSHDVIGKAFHTDTGVMVYGLAAIMVTPNYGGGWYGENINEYDTTASKCVEKLMLYQYLPDGNERMVQLNEKLPISLVDTPVTYYLDMHTLLFNRRTPAPPFPVYEVYYEVPQRVMDTFFVAFSLRYRRTAADLKPMPFGPVGFAPYDTWENYFQEEWHAYRTNDGADGYDYGAWYYHSTPSWTFLFPILTPRPEPQDTVVPPDTTAVGQVDLVSRYVTVSPNPATDRVQVLSSFGLTHLEAYDADGRRVAEREASGLEATLDVTAWPRGTYLLRITTPVGTVTKKLLVQ